ncbi:MAG: hypothetical protein WB511_06545 [Nitrososphaeraceae archaeon]
MNQEDYNFLEMMVKRFRLDENAKTVQRTASIANNIQPTETAMKINQLIKTMNGQRMGSVIDEVGLLKHYLKLQ